jgi:hypothetical protein
MERWLPEHWWIRFRAFERSTCSLLRVIRRTTCIMSSPTRITMDFEYGIGVLFTRVLIQMVRAPFPAMTSLTPSAAAKQASNQGPKLLALASESGTVKLLDTRYNAQQHRSAAPNTTSWHVYPHQNAVFDVQWDANDESLLTASGDQTGAVHSLGEGEARRVATLVGHTSSLKTCAWYDQSKSPVCFPLCRG